MAKIKRCSGCDTPLAVSREQVWNLNGTITQASDPDHRMLFYESDNLDRLFRGIEEIIGVPVERIVIESKAREVKEYVRKMVSPLKRRFARFRPGTVAMVSRLAVTGRCYGYGDVSLSGHRRKGDDGDYITMSVDSPHSVLFSCGEYLGAWEAIDGRDNTVSYRKTGEDRYEITCRVGEHPIELAGRLASPAYRPRPGNTRLERCELCGVPLVVAAYDWDLGKGTIRHPETGTRMAVFGPAGLEAVLNDLETELGDAIPEAVVEAQRRYVHEVMAGAGAWGDLESYREMMAFRGLGNITEFEAGDSGMSIRIENPCLILVTVGMVQAFFELASGREMSSREYRLSEDGDLLISVGP